MYVLCIFPLRFGFGEDALVVPNIGNVFRGFKNTLRVCLFLGSAEAVGLPDWVCTDGIVWSSESEPEIIDAILKRCGSVRSSC